MTGGGGKGRGKKEGWSEGGEAKVSPVMYAWMILHLHVAYLGLDEEYIE